MFRCIVINEFCEKCVMGEGSFLSDSICLVTAGGLTKLGICNEEWRGVFFCTSALPDI